MTTEFPDGMIFGQECGRLPCDGEQLIRDFETWCYRLQQGYQGWQDRDFTQARTDHARAKLVAYVHQLYEKAYPKPVPQWTYNDLWRKTK